MRTSKDFYTQDWTKFVDYNIRDVELVSQLEDKLGLIELQITMAYDFRVNYEDVFSQVRCWDMLIYNTCVEEILSYHLSRFITKRYCLCWCLCERPYRWST